MNSFKNIDVALNGLQVTRVEQEITRVAFAVDAALTTIEQAAQQKADMLFVHHVLPFGGEKIKTVAIISGGAPFEVRQAIEEHIDLYVTGDASHSVYHQCREAEINMISAGHYATETWGVRSLKNLLEQEKNIECTFIDAPTAL
ncbi:hypothetical protein LSH36_1091g00204 [Paralvinella palmiformis]|uniref:Nif3-like dinuclear metal center hexameric protein n=1 Tax=Paralvinella palmiformis TaxID=53620 RepID=A0AAD9IWS7_9ANNE|nr:hypothetical protein LSH36_1091g00204 [Paralvinella palmiformis]